MKIINTNTNIIEFMSVAIDTTTTEIDKDSYDEEFATDGQTSDSDVPDELDARIFPCNYFTCGFTV